MTALSEIEQELKTTFPSHSYQEWREAAEALLKGKPFEKLLVTPTYEGFDLQPIFRKEDLDALTFCRDFPGAGSYVRARNSSGNYLSRWKISQEQPAHSAEKLNDSLKKEIKGGVDEINILLDVASQKGIDPDQAATGEVGGCGLSLTTLADLEKALNGIDIQSLSLFIQSGTSGLAVLSLLKAYCEKKGIAFQTIQGNIGSDPIGSWARYGSLPMGIEGALSETAEVVRTLSETGSAMGGIYVDGNVYHNAGASATQELGFTLAAANEYLRALTAKGLSVEEIASSMRFGLGIGSHYFLEIGKFRAARMLWARILKAWGASFENLPIHLHARTSIWNKTKIDPYVNMLRVTSEAFSAVIGGCDSMHIGPFDEVLRLPDDFSRRIARNVHFVLGEECELTRVIDPAGGSYYVEWLTDQIAEKAWQWFQKVEAEGGLIESLKKGTAQKAISDVVQKRIANVEKRRDVIVGTNQYPNSTEKLLDPRPVDYAGFQKERGTKVAAMRGKAALTGDLVKGFTQGATIGEIYAGLRKGASESDRIEVIPIRRASESYEKLRSASIAYAGKNGHAPQIFQANWGPSRSYRLRADWTSAFFQAGGFELLNDTDFDSVEKLLEALKLSKSKVVVITSTDDAYAEKVVEIAQAIQSLDSSIYIIVAGAPDAQEASWRAAGVADFVNVRVNNYEMLAMLHKKLGVIS
jgi:methylmalonyl-CoA mutase